MPTIAQRWGGRLLGVTFIQLGTSPGLAGSPAGGGRSPCFVSSTHVIVTCFSHCPVTARMKSISIQQTTAGPGLC